jgi:outer membrane immunogenic protein
MRKLILAALLLSATAASAADLGAYPTKAPPPIGVPYDAFSGFYVGANVGYGWDFGTSASASQAVPLATLATLPQGFLGGLEAGYGFRPNSVLYLGIEGDVDGAALTGSSTMPGPVTAESKNTWLASLRADIGIVPIGHALFYGTLGYGWGGGEFTVNELFRGGGTASVSPTMNGFVWGGGVKVPLGPNWIAGVKYLQYDFGSFALANPSIPGLIFTGKDRVDAVRAELIHKF